MLLEMNLLFSIDLKLQIAGHVIIILTHKKKKNIPIQEKASLGRWVRLSIGFSH